MGVWKRICACSGVSEGLFVCTLSVFMFALRPPDCTGLIATLCVNAYVPMCATYLLCSADVRFWAKTAGNTERFFAPHCLCELCVYRRCSSSIMDFGLAPGDVIRTSVSSCALPVKMGAVSGVVTEGEKTSERAKAWGGASASRMAERREPARKNVPATERSKVTERYCRDMPTGWRQKHDH